MQTTIKKVPMGLTGPEWKIFIDTLIKMNDQQLDHAESLIKKEQVKRWNARGVE